MKNKWYVGNTGNHQGLIIDEKTGDNIAVSYKKEDAALIAAAPELLEALKDLIVAHGMGLWKTTNNSDHDVIDNSERIINKVEGN